MKRLNLISLVCTVLLFISSAECLAQVKSQPFKGIWFSPDFVVEINFYSKNIPDPNSMNDDPCPGLIKLKDSDKSYGSIFTICSTKIMGNKANVIVYDGDGGKIPVDLEYTSNGSLIFYPKNLTHLSKQADGLSKFSKPSYTLSKQGPFTGEWKTRNRSGKLTINLYDKVISGPDPIECPACYGTIYITQGTRVDECTIVDCKPNNNEATIDYVDGRDENTYRCTLVYNPANKQISIKDNQKVKGDSEVCDSFVSNALVFMK